MDLMQLAHCISQQPLGAVPARATQSLLLIKQGTGIVWPLVSGAGSSINEFTLDEQT